MPFKLSLENFFFKRSSDSFYLISSASIVLNNIVFLDLKESIKACDSNSLMIKDAFSYLTFLSSLLEFLEILLNFKKNPQGAHYQNSLQIAEKNS
jgi:hypothetical protein